MVSSRRPVSASCKAASDMSETSRVGMPGASVWPDLSAVRPEQEYLVEIVLVIALSYPSRLARSAGTIRMLCSRKPAKPERSETM